MTPVLVQDLVPPPGLWPLHPSKRLSIVLEDASWLHLYLEVAYLWTLRGKVSASFSFTSILMAQLIGVKVVYFRVSSYTRDFIHEKLMKGETDSFVCSSCGGTKKIPPALIRKECPVSSLYSCCESNALTKGSSNSAVYGQLPLFLCRIQPILTSHIGVVLSIIHTCTA